MILVIRLYYDVFICVTLAVQNLFDGFVDPVSYISPVFFSVYVAVVEVNVYAQSFKLLEMDER
jgi:hypothetical protein